MSFARKIALWIMFSATFSVSALGMSVLPMDLSQLTRKADRIFVGRCLEVTSDLDENQIPSTYVRFQVLEGIKGVVSGETILIKEFGVFSPWRSLQVREGESALVPMKTLRVSEGEYRSGEEYLLFLYPNSDRGFTSPVGAGQGKFVVKGMKNYKQMVDQVEKLVIR